MGREGNQGDREREVDRSGPGCAWVFSCVCFVVFVVSQGGCLLPSIYMGSVNACLPGIIIIFICDQGMLNQENSMMQKCGSSVP